MAYEYVEKNGKIQLRQSSAASFFAQATQSCMSLEERIDQIEDKILDSNPVTKKIHEKIKAVDEKISSMKYGNVYSKFKKMAQGMGRLLIAKEIGVAAVAGLCVYNFARNMKPMFYDAEKARQNYECEDISDYMVKNKSKSARTIAKATLGAVAASCGLGDAYMAREVARTGVASIVAWPELKNIYKTAKDFVTQKASWRDFTAACALFGTTVAAYAYGSGVWNTADVDTAGVDTHTDISGGHTDSSSADVVGKADGSASLSDAKKKEKKEQVDIPAPTYDLNPSEKTIVMPLQSAIKKFENYFPTDKEDTIDYEDVKNGGKKSPSLQSSIAQQTELPTRRHVPYRTRKAFDAAVKKAQISR